MHILRDMGMSNLIALCNGVTSVVDEERKVVISPDFSKVFNTVFHNILVDSLTTYRLGKWTGRYI